MANAHPAVSRHEPQQIQVLLSKPDYQNVASTNCNCCKCELAKRCTSTPRTMAHTCTDDNSTWNDMDEYLCHLGLQRKSIVRDESCLFRAVADQVLLSQEQHQLVRRDCVLFLLKKRIKFQNFVEGCFDWYLQNLSNPKVRPGQIELVALSEMNKHEFLIFMDVHRPPMNVTQNSFKNQIVLCLSDSNHYDIVYPKSFMINSQLCRSLLCELLYERVFPMSSDSMGAEMDPCSTPVTMRPESECEKGQENQEKMSVSESENMRANSAKDREMFAPEVGQSVEGCHAETENEDNNQKELSSGDKCQSVSESENMRANSAKDREMFAPEVGQSVEGCHAETENEDNNQKELSSGDKCQVLLTDQKLYPARIEEVSGDQQSVTVYIEELGIKTTVPASSLHPLNKSVQDIDSQKRRQRKRREMPLVVPFGRGSLLPARLHSRTPGRPGSRVTAPRLAAAAAATQESHKQSSHIDEEEERRFIQDSVALIELQERDPAAFPALPNRQNTGKGPKSFWGGDTTSFRETNQQNSLCNSDEEAPTQLSVSPPPTPLTSSPVSSSSPQMRSGPMLVEPRLSRTGGPFIPTVLPGMPIMPPITNKESPIFINSSSGLPANAAKSFGPSSAALESHAKSARVVKSPTKPKCPSTDHQSTIKHVPASAEPVTNSVDMSHSLANQSDSTSADTLMDSHTPTSLVKIQPAKLSESDTDKTTVPDNMPIDVSTEAPEISECDEQTTASRDLPNTTESTATAQVAESESAKSSAGRDEMSHPPSDDLSHSNSQAQSSEVTATQITNISSCPEVSAPRQEASSSPIVPHLVSSSVINNSSVPHPAQAMNTAISHTANTPLRPPYMHPLAFPQPPPLPPRMPFSVPSYPWLAVTSAHLSNMAGPINFNVMPSSDPSGSDLPHTDVNTLRFFFNLGYEYYRASMIQLSAQFPVMQRRSDDGSRGAESIQVQSQNTDEKSEDTKKSEGVVVYVENDEESCSSSTEEDKSENHNTSYEELTGGPCHGDSGCVSDVSSNENEHRNDANDQHSDQHSDSSSQHSNGSATLSAEFINFCRTFCSPASTHSQNSNHSRRSPMVTGKLLKPLKDIPPRFQKMLSQNAVGKEQQFEGPPLVRQVAMSSHKNSSKNSSTSTLSASASASASAVEETSNHIPGSSFNPDAQSFTPSSSYECNVNQSYSSVVYAQPENGVPFSSSEDYPPPYSYYMNGTCYYPPPAMGPAPIPVPAPAPAPGGTQYVQCQYYIPYPQPCQGAPTTVVYSQAPPPSVSYNYPAPQPPQPQAAHYTYTS